MMIRTDLMTLSILDEGRKMLKQYADITKKIPRYLTLSHQRPNTRDNRMEANKYMYLLWVISIVNLYIVYNIKYVKIGFKTSVSNLPKHVLPYHIGLEIPANNE